MRSLLVILAAACMLAQCGPSQEERARIQKAREDSITLAAQKATLLKIQQKQTLEQEIQTLEFTIEGKKNLLTVLNADLVVQRDKLARIKQPQFLRTPQERESQIRTMVITIHQTEKNIEGLKVDLSDLTKKANDLKQEVKKYE